MNDQSSLRSGTSGAFIKKHILDLIWLLMLALSFGFMLWKAPYSFGTDDEPFYYTVAHRLVLGDQLFQDEWHVSQLYSFFLYPYVALFLKLRGSTEGMLLTARYIYLVLHAGVGVCIYLRLRKYGPAAAAASIVYTLFSPFDIMTYCYNNTALDLLVLAGLLWSAWPETAGLPQALGGFCYAGAVICCPYLAIGWFLWLAAVIVLQVLKKRRSSLSVCPLFLPRSFGMMTCGVVCMAVCFLVFFFRFSSLDALIENLPYVMADPEHPHYSVVYIVKHYIYCIITADTYILLPLGLYVLSLIVLAADAKRMTRRGLHFCFALAAGLLCLLIFIPRLTDIHYNSFMLPALLPGFTAYLLLEKKPSRLFWGLFIPGLLYSFCVGATSNLGFRVIAMAMSVSDLAAFVFCGQLLQELHAGAPERRLSLPAVLSLAAVVLLLGMECVSKAEHCYWSSAPSEMTQTVAVGPAKGLKEDDADIAFYESIWNDLSFFEDKEPENVLFFSDSTWAYLMLSDYPYGTFSAWLSGPDETSITRLLEYYSLNPDKIPTYILVPKTLQISETTPISEYVEYYAGLYGYTIDSGDACYILTKY